MGELFAILVGAALVNNVVLMRFLGLCPFMGAADRVDSAIALALATSFVLTVATVFVYLLEHLVLAPLGAEYLRLMGFVLIIAATVQLTEILVLRINPLLHQVLGLHLPLIASNCAILGITLLNLREARSFVESLTFGVGTAAGFSLVLVLFSGLRQRVEVADVPAAFRGPAIALVTAGLMSLAFMGLSGLVSE